MKEILTRTFFYCSRDGKREDHITFTYYGHSGVRMTFKGLEIYVDPYLEVFDYTGQPKADLIVISHDHDDHLDLKAISLIRKDSTEFVGNKDVQRVLKEAHVLNNGDNMEWKGINIKAVPAYNIDHKNPETNEPFHPKGVGNGYIFDFDEFLAYFAGDTEFIPEMKDLPKEMNVVFLPNNLPYTMDDDMFIAAVNLLKPQILFRYHYFDPISKETEARIPEQISFVKP
ncbi:MAG: MBL fold metallo-hydrolase [Bacteroidales bacterium]